MSQVADIVQDPHQAHKGMSHTAHWLAIAGAGTALVAGAVILSPYLLPLLHVGNSQLAEEALLAMHGTGLGNGLAGSINGVINTVPFVGAAIAKGGVASAVATGVVGIGGVLLGRFISKKEDGTIGIRWGNVICCAALITSSLIAMPTILTSVSVGIVYLCAAFSGVQLASAAVTLLAKTLGSVGAMNLTTTGLSGATAALPHFLTCGMSIIPATTAWIMGKKHKTDNTHVEHEAMSHMPPLSSQGKNSDRIAATIELSSPLKVGEPCTVKLTLKDKYTNQPITYDDLATVHTQKMHLLIADQSLKDYHHVHPVPSNEAGVYTFSFIPATANGYHVWTDLTLAQNNQEQKVLTDIPSPNNRNITPTITYNSTADANGLHCVWNPESVLQKNKPSIVEINVADGNGNPIHDLEPTMGAYAHLVGFSADGKSLIHAHPLDTPNNLTDTLGGPKLRFHIEPENAGATQFYLQVKRGGNDIFVPFGKQIKQASLAENILPLRQQHAMSHAVMR